jgi:hypothetical protein
LAQERDAFALANPLSKIACSARVRIVVRPGQPWSSSSACLMSLK